MRWRVIQIIWWQAAWWLAARCGRAQGPGQKADGQRLAGPGPDWPALPELGRAVTMVVARRFGNLVLTLALTFYPLPQERKSAAHVFIFSADHPAIPALVFPRTRRTILPLRQRELGENILRSRERERMSAGQVRVVGENHSLTGEGGRRPAAGHTFVGGSTKRWLKPNWRRGLWVRLDSFTRWKRICVNKRLDRH